MDITTSPPSTKRLRAAITCATFDVARTHHHVTRDHIKCDVTTPTAVPALPASPSLVSEKLAKPEHPCHIKSDAPHLDRKNRPQKPVGESVGVKEAEERRREERRPEKKVREWTRSDREQERMPCKHDDARGMPAPSPLTAPPPRTRLIEHPTTPTALTRSHAMPLRHGARTPTAPVTQDVDNMPATSPAPGARDHDSVALTRVSTAPQCSCTTAPTAAAAQDTNDAHTTSPARGAQARDSLTPMRLAVRATDRPTAQVVPSAPMHRGCATEPTAAAVQDADVATDTPPALRTRHAGADAQARPALLTHRTALTASGAHTQDDAPATPPTPRARQASAMTWERTVSPTHPVTVLPAHHAASLARGARVHDNVIPVHVPLGRTTCPRFVKQVLSRSTTK
ncbi:hypothetical protein BKA93DRAFT_821310 [Sparassis latifolia]